MGGKTVVSHSWRVNDEHCSTACSRIVGRVARGEHHARSCAKCERQSALDTARAYDEPAGNKSAIHSRAHDAVHDATCTNARASRGRYTARDRRNRRRYGDQSRHSNAAYANRIDGGPSHARDRHSCNASDDRYAGSFARARAEPVRTSRNRRPARTAFANGSAAASAVGRAQTLSEWAPAGGP